MATTTVKHEAFADLDLLRSVCIHKDRFYHCDWAQYLEAEPGRFHLRPRNERIPALRKDYESMRVMFFEEAPSFEDMLDQIGELEQEINLLQP